MDEAGWRGKQTLRKVGAEMRVHRSVGSWIGGTFLSGEENDREMTRQGGRRVEDCHVLVELLGPCRFALPQSSIPTSLPLPVVIAPITLPANS